MKLTLCSSVCIAVTPSSKNVLKLLSPRFETTSYVSIVISTGLASESPYAVSSAAMVLITVAVS